MHKKNTKMQLHRKFQYARGLMQLYVPLLRYDIVGILNIYYLTVKFLALLYYLIMDLPLSNLSNSF